MTAREPLPEPGPALAWRNRRILADRCGWPAGALEECERLDPVYPRWWITWSPANDIPGFERPAGFCGTDLDYWGWHPVPACGATTAALVDAITARTSSAQLVATMDAVQVAIYAAGLLEEAVGDLPATPPGELFNRFLAWTRRPLT